MGKAFGTTIMEYDVDGVIHHGNATELMLPRALAGFVSGVATMHDLRRAPQPGMIKALALPNAEGRQGTGTGGNSFIGPGDFATIYNLNPLFAKGITGQGVSIGIVGQTDLPSGDFQTFRTTFGLTGYPGTLTLVETGPSPGLVDPGDELESELDTQWASAAAPGAAVTLAISPSSATTGGIDLSAQYLVDQNQVQVLSLSYGDCEADMGGPGSTYVTFYEQLWAQAAGQGISVLVSSGDSGAAMCDAPNHFTATRGRAVNGLGSTPYNTCVGGTMFTGTGAQYWKAGTASTLQTTALGYVPEAAWDESSLNATGYRLFAGGGGASTCWPKPGWQDAPGVPSDAWRDVPDVALNAGAISDPTFVVSGGSGEGVGGTSVAAPCMAGIMALVVQQFGRQGNPNPTLYALGKAQYNQTGPTVFHDITSGNNSVPGQIGFNAGPGYDQVTGLGSLDAQALVENWVAGTNPIQVQVSAPAANPTIATGASVSFAGSATDATPGAALTYLWSFGDGATATGTSAQHTYTLQGSQAQTFTANLTVGDGLHVKASSPVQVTVTPAGVSAAITQPVTDSYAFPGVVVPFTATASTLNPGSITSYAWDFGDGAKASGASVSHAFVENDQYYWQVTLTATDATGATGQTSLLLLADPAILMNPNGDSSIDVRDLLLLAGAWNPTPATATRFNGLNIWADLNGDGVVNDADLELWINNFTPAAP